MKKNNQKLRTLDARELASVVGGDSISAPQSSPQPAPWNSLVGDQDGTGPGAYYYNNHWWYRDRY
jgi:hypothetical protein